MTGRGGQTTAGSTWPVNVITDARPGASEEQWRRQKRYMITMAFRTACFLAMLFVPGVWRWVLFAGAVFLPYVAVVFANQVDNRGRASEPLTPGGPEALPQLTTGEQLHRADQDVEGETVDDADGDMAGGAGAGEARTEGARAEGARTDGVPAEGDRTDRDRSDGVTAPRDATGDRRVA